jgi:hypothetical protein
VERPGWHRRRVRPQPSESGATRVLRRRGGVDSPLRSHHTAVDRHARRAARAAARRSGGGHRRRRAPAGLRPRRRPGHHRRARPARRDVGGGARPPPAARGPRRPATRRARDAGRDRCRVRARHAGSPALHRALRPAHRGARTLARRRLHGAPGRRRRAPGRAPAPDPARQQRRDAHRGLSRCARIAGDRGGRMLGGDRDLGGGARAAHRGGDLRRPAPHAAPAEVPAGRRPHGVHRPCGGRSGRP